MFLRGLRFLVFVLLMLMVSIPAFADGVDFLRSLSSLGDRSIGTPGADKAADMVEAEFKRLLPKASILERQTFHVPVPMQEGAQLTLAGSGRRTELKQLRANALSPGAVAPPGIKGVLIYVGSGRVADFNGLNVEGSVVLMDMDSGKNWNNAAMLGARDRKSVV